ncbi:hypothetical protein [Streptomyces rapamycinicus]|uniref:Uncharacterized protein n=2 Tax=Streptomyces rapamycinicus TaxID=1226757 RepID=A0A0A0NVR3_STRRN|nr:hypothetical protein [Streptomyces rapamycinicus]AGP59140.1 hypothetical protein M271_38755 [Streptomyces rapamycinicus NRRL 5491]MBB4786869.1 hypothetical protein [Streptomyces rapamycinicus]RLV77674.1 hypothetical protein D3C57_104855 [Streptomyces rapamycinicus NRRL 5491]UTO66900.1 hypothetical protein LJB45_34315 [Streptomyces rapamycinicus]UTP34855.1 hypothetical protein LIV37_39445 [Streptomyces rapamycinicus NRRL 5491]
MTDWTWEYNPSEEHVAGGLAPGVMAEVMRLATELAALGVDAAKVGRPLDREGGLREFDILGGRGFISFLAVARHHCVYVCNITWYG